MDGDNADPAYLGGELLLLNYLHVVGVVVLYYDHLITASKEVDLVWRRGKSLSSYCFFVNRYFAFVSGIPVAVIPFLAPSTETCHRLSLFREGAIVLTQLIAGGTTLSPAFISGFDAFRPTVIMIIRVYALFGRTRRVLWFMIATAASVVAVSLWSVSGQEGSRSTLIGGCHYSLTESTAYHLAGSWLALFCFDAIIFALTIYHAHYAHRWRIRQTNIHTLVVRDGAMYFGVLALANLANIATYYFVEYWPYLPGALATFANCISVTMISRLLLNLHEHASAGILTEPADPHAHLSSVDGEPMTEVDETNRRILNDLGGLRSAVM
ncbi:hypothetical protein MVEN_01861900 [Mycena venus]|uniref:DUF6533 domain-containing protein n=1 Tax=Mycena venus TaxID=2733690 RepID=A0A8H7CMA4_9AGAR|nr:hypothetical protein MVEN_01861900 [Mycena venus]